MRQRAARSVASTPQKDSRAKYGEPACTTPYHVDVPSFGDWGFLLASEDRFPALTLAPPPGGPLRFLDRPTLSAAASFPPDRARIALKPSTLNRPRVLDYQRRGYRGY